MPPKIYNVKEPLNLDRLRLAKPVNKNGTHFIKTLDGDNPIYFLGPKCLSKNGFVKSGKKIFCDFVFSNEDSDFLNWLENLEESARKSIYTNRETWFETPLDEHDIESSMTSPYKPYKSGKFFIVRANVPTALDKINIKIYDENEKETDPENIKENTKVLAVFEFQGIRCSVRSFQFEIELKQLLIVEPDKLFEKCIIGSSLSSSLRESENMGISSITPSLSREVDVEVDVEVNSGKVEDMSAIFPDRGNEVLSKQIVADNIIAQDQMKDAINKSDTLELEDPKIEQIFDLLPTIADIHPIEITDEEFPLENITEKEPPLKLKSRNDVYYKLYREMRQRAKEAKREALANYLEAKRIKNTYLLEDVSDSESDDEGDAAEISV